jgi:hypothetical protein
MPGCAWIRRGAGSGILLLGAGCFSGQDGPSSGAANSSSESEAAGVAESSSTDPAFTRDSAGVRIVEYGDVSAVSAPFRVDASPIYRVGWEGGVEWGSVGGGVLLEGGGAAILDQVALQVVELSDDGSVERTLGRPGEGPGEFEMVFAIATVGDTIVAQEMFRLTFFHGGELLRTMPVVINRPFPVPVLSSDPGGGLLFGGPPSAIGIPRAGPQPPWREFPLIRLDLATGVADSVGSAALFQSPEARGDNPFGARGYVTAWEGGFARGRGHAPEITWLDARGAVRQIVRWQPSGAPLTDDVWSTYERTWRARWDDIIARGQTRETPATLETTITRYRAAAKGPLPEFVGLHTDSDGNVWTAGFDVEDWAGGLSTRSRRYFVVSPEGEWLGYVDLPPGLRILDIGRDHILAVEKNDLDVEAVAAYRIER